MELGRRGAVLIIVVIFMLVALIASLASYNSVYYLFNTQGVKEAKWGKGYYLASAGITYASMLLKDPHNYAGFTTDPPADGDWVQKILTSASGSLGASLGLTGSQTITVKITYVLLTNKYSVTSTYSY